MTPFTKRPSAAPLLLCVLALALCPHLARAEAWYQPAPEDFRPIYDRDIANQHYQSWDGRDSYWYWVQTFYNGYKKRVLGVSVVRQQGWTATSQRLVSHIASEPARQALTMTLNTLGRTIVGEWAKNDHACRIHTRDLRRGRDMLAQAGSQDSGSGQVLLATAHAVQAEADTHLKGRP